MQSYNLITVLGPTAIGKTRLAAKLAMEFNGEIISADSRQVYKGMDIGTGKDLQDYIVDGKQITYHLIDIAEPDEEYNLFRFIKDFSSVFGGIETRNKIPFLTGGTGLYLDAILKNYILKESLPDEEYRNYLNTLTNEELQKKLRSLNPALHNTTDLIEKDRIIRAIEIAGKGLREFKKPAIKSLVIGVRMEREIVKERITNRLKQRLNTGMIEEVKQLVEKGLSYDKLNFFGLEYRYISLYLQHKLSYDEMFLKLNIAIHNFSKRQMTWFRKMERDGIEINWIEGADCEKAKEVIRNKYFISEVNKY